MITETAQYLIDITIVGTLCDGDLGCVDVKAGLAQVDQKVIQKSISFVKRSVSALRLLQSIRSADSM